VTTGLSRSTFLLTRQFQTRQKLRPTVKCSTDSDVLVARQSYLRQQQLDLGAFLEDDNSHEDGGSCCKMSTTVRQQVFAAQAAAEVSTSSLRTDAPHACCRDHGPVVVNCRQVRYTPAGGSRRSEGRERRRRRRRTSRTPATAIPLRGRLEMSTMNRGLCTKETLVKSG
jgi:hypothetical protein